MGAQIKGMHGWRGDVQKGSVCARGEKGGGSQAPYTEKVVGGSRGGLLDKLGFRATVEFGAALGFRTALGFGAEELFGSGFGAAVGFGGASGSFCLPQPYRYRPPAHSRTQLHPRSFTTKPSRALNCGSAARVTQGREACMHFEHQSSLSLRPVSEGGDLGVPGMCPPPQSQPGH